MRGGGEGTADTGRARGRECAQATEQARHRTRLGSVEEGLPGLVEEELTTIGEGRLALITVAPWSHGSHRAVPAPALGELGRARPVPGGGALAAARAKGFESDSVVVFESGTGLSPPGTGEREGITGGWRRRSRSR